MGCFNLWIGWLICWWDVLGVERRGSIYFHHYFPFNPKPSSTPSFHSEMKFSPILLEIVKNYSFPVLLPRPTYHKMKVTELILKCWQKIFSLKMNPKNFLSSQLCNPVLENSSVDLQLNSEKGKLEGNKSYHIPKLFDWLWFFWVSREKISSEMQ